MYPEEEMSVRNSPVEEIAQDKATTDRTSRTLFELEAEIRDCYKEQIILFLSYSAVEIEHFLFGHMVSTKPSALRLRNRYGTYGFYLPPGIQIEDWRHPDPGYQDLSELPRLIIMPNIVEDDWQWNRASLFNRDLLMGSMIEEVDNALVYNKQPRMGIVRFTRSRLMIMLALAPSLELVTDWSDISALTSSSFSGSLAPLRHSCRELFALPSGIVSRHVQDNVPGAETMKMSARIPRTRQ